MRKSNDPLLMKINKHKTSHQDSKQLFSPSSKSDGSSISPGNISASQRIKSPSYRAPVKSTDLERSTRRSGVMMTDGRIKSSLNLDKLSVKSSTNYEKISPVSKKKVHKRSEDVDLQKMLIEQYQQSNALLAQNINTLLLLNQQAAANQIVTSTKPVLENTLKAPAFTALLGKTSVTTSVALSKVNTSVTTSPLSKQIIDQARSKVKSSTTIQTIPSTKVISTRFSVSNASAVKPVNGVTSVATSNMLSLKSTLVGNDRNSIQSQVKGNLQSQLSLYKDKSILNKTNLSIQNQVKGNLHTQLAFKDKSVLNKSLSSHSQTQSSSKSLSSTKKDAIKLQFSSTPEKSDSSRSSMLSQDKSNISRSQSDKLSTPMLSQDKSNLSRSQSDKFSTPKKDNTIKKDQGLGDITEYLRQQSKSSTSQMLSQSRGSSKLFLSDKSTPVTSSSKLTTTKSSSSSQPSQSAAAIMKSILNAKLPPKTPINDPRLSAERIRKNSLSNLSDSGDSLFSSSGNFADSLLDESFMKSRKVSVGSVGSDKSDVSDKSNELKSGKSPLKPDAPRLSLSEYQQRRKEGVKVHATDDCLINVKTTIQSDAVNFSHHDVTSSNFLDPSEKPNLITSFSFSESTKVNGNKSSSFLKPASSLEGKDKSSNPAKFSSIRSSSKYADDDFFIPRKASSLLYRDIPDVAPCDLISEKKELKPKAGFSDGDGGEREIKITQKNVATSDTSTNKQKRRNDKINTDTESSTHSKVRVDDDIEFEYQAFLKSIGVSLKSRKTLLKRKNMENAGEVDTSTEKPAESKDGLSVGTSGSIDAITSCGAERDDKICTSSDYTSLKGDSNPTMSTFATTSSISYRSNANLHTSTSSSSQRGKSPREKILIDGNQARKAPDDHKLFIDPLPSKTVNAVSSFSPDSKIGSLNASFTNMKKGTSLLNISNKVLDVQNGIQINADRDGVGTVIDPALSVSSASSQLLPVSSSSNLKAVTSDKISGDTLANCDKPRASCSPEDLSEMKVTNTSIDISTLDNTDTTTTGVPIVTKMNTVHHSDEDTDESVVETSDDYKKDTDRTSAGKSYSESENLDSNIDFNIDQTENPMGEVFIWESPRVKTVVGKTYPRVRSADNKVSASDDYPTSSGLPSTDHSRSVNDVSCRGASSNDDVLNEVASDCRTSVVGKAVDQVGSRHKSIVEVVDNHDKLKNCSSESSIDLPITSKNVTTHPTNNVSELEVLSNKVTSSSAEKPYTKIIPKITTISNSMSSSVVAGDSNISGICPNARDKVNTYITGEKDCKKGLSQPLILVSSPDTVPAKPTQNDISGNDESLSNKSGEEDGSSSNDKFFSVIAGLSPVSSLTSANDESREMESESILQYEIISNTELSDDFESSHEGDRLVKTHSDVTSHCSSVGDFDSSVKEKLQRINSPAPNCDDNSESVGDFDCTTGINVVDVPVITPTDNISDIATSRSDTVELATSGNYSETPVNQGPAFSSVDIKSSTMNIDPLTIDADSTPYIVPAGLSKLEQLASIAMSESHASFSGYSNNNTVVTPESSSPLIDLPFLSCPSPLPPSKEGGNTEKSNIKKSKTRKKVRRTSKLLQKKRGDRVKSKKLISDDELSAENVSEPENSTAVSLTPAAEPNISTEQMDVVTTETPLKSSSAKKSRSGKPRGSHSCDICKKHFTLARLLNSHMKRDHPADGTEDEVQGNTDSAKIESTIPYLSGDTQTARGNDIISAGITAEDEKPVSIKSEKDSKKTEKLKRIEKGRKTRASKKANDTILEDVKDEKDGVKEESKDVIVDAVSDEKMVVHSDQKIFDEKYEVKFNEAALDENSATQVPLGEESSTSKRRRTSKTPEDHRKPRLKRKESIEKSGGKSALDCPDTSQDLSLTEIKPSKIKRNSKGDIKRDEKAKLSDGEETSGIANSIRTKIQKLLSFSDSIADTTIEPPFASPLSYPEGIGKRQPKATLKKKAFMEELHSQKSRRKRVKPQINPIPEIMAMTAANTEKIPNEPLDSHVSAVSDSEINIPKKSNSLISMMTIDKEEVQNEIEEETVPDEAAPLETPVAPVAPVVPSEKEIPNELTLDNIVKTVMTSPSSQRKYKCKICSSEFWKEQQLTEHAQKHNQRTYDCYKCTEKFTTMRAFTRHLLVHDEVRYASTERPHDCDSCGYKCETENQLIVHKKTHEIHACTLCSTKYHQLTELYNHISKCHPEGMQQVLRCAHCEESFNNLPEFRKHLIRVHEMTTKQAAVACKNKGVIPEEFRKAEEEKKRIMEEKRLIIEEKRRAKGLILKSRVEEKVIPRKKDVVRKAKEVIQKSRKVKMNLRRDAALSKAAESSDPPALDSTISTESISNVTALNEGTDVNKEEKGETNDSHKIPLRKRKASISADKEITDKEDSEEVSKEKPEVVHSGRKLRSHRKLDEQDEQKNDEQKNDDLIEQEKNDEKEKTDEPQKDLPRRKTRLPMGALENIFNRVEALHQDQTGNLIEVPKPISRQSSIEDMKSPKPCKVSPKEELKTGLKSNNQDKKKEYPKDELKISIKSPTHDRKDPFLVSPLQQDLSPNLKKSSGTEEEKVLSEEEQKQMKLKFESAERTARMLIRNQRRTTDGSQGKRSRKSSAEKNDLSPSGTPVERIEPVKIKAVVKLNEFDRQTTEFVLTSPDLSDNNDGETTKKSTKRKGKRRSGRVSQKDSIDVPHKGRKRGKLSLPNERNKDERMEATSMELESPFDGNVSLCESQPGDSDEITCLLPGGIDFDKEYDYKNRTKEKTFLTEDDLMSSLMTLADCAIDAPHMVEMKDMHNRKLAKTEHTDVKDEVKDEIDGDVKVKVDEITRDVCNNLDEDKADVDSKPCLDLKVQIDTFESHADDHSQFLQPPSDEQGYCFTPTPTLDHDYFGNFDPDSINMNSHASKSDGNYHVNDVDPLGGSGDFATAGGTPHADRSKSVDQSKELNIDCSDTVKTPIYSTETLLRVCDAESSKEKYNRKLRKSSSSSNQMNDSDDEQTFTEVKKFNIDFVSEQIGSRRDGNLGTAELRNKTPQMKSKYRNKKCESSAEKSDCSILLALDDSCDSSTSNNKDTIRRPGVKKVRKRCLESEGSYDDENWCVPESSTRNASYNKFACSDVVIKTEEDAFDIDVQANDINDISDLNQPPIEEINNNLNERENNSANSVKFYSCDNNIRRRGDNEKDLYENDADNGLPNNSNALDTDSVVSLSPTVINKTVSDLIALSGGVFYCRYCRRKYRKESSVKQHTLTHINSLKHPFKCLNCPSSFRKCSEYIDHKSVHVKTDSTQPINSSNDPETGTRRTESEEGSCTETRLCPKPDNIRKEDDKSQKKICCKYCPLDFNNHRKYKLHLRNNHNIWQTISGKKSSVNHSSLRCFKCDLEFSCRKTLFRHEKFVHSQKSDGNICLICGRTFLKSIYLKSHTRTHQGIYPFRCLQCGSVFRKQAQLYNHVKSHQKL